MTHATATTNSITIDLSEPHGGIADHDVESFDTSEDLLGALATFDARVAEIRGAVGTLAPRDLDLDLEADAFDEDAVIDLIAAKNTASRTSRWRARGAGFLQTLAA